MLPLTLAICCSAAVAALQMPTPEEHDFTVQSYSFADGESMSDIRLHCTTLGTPQRDPRTGKIGNAVLIMHGTGGTGHQFLSPVFANVLFKPGQLLDATKYYIILPDAFGHGRSSKPSDGLHAKFPHYGYHDIVRLQHKMITEDLKVDHLRLVMGTSMGGMQTWMWGEMYPDFMDALMPLACLPVEIAGRNRMTRKMIIDDIVNDPGYEGGEYKTQPRGLRAAVDILLILGSSSLQMMKQSPTRDQADKMLDSYEQAQLEHTDANNMVYYFSASSDYNPEPDLEKIQAPLIHVNSADDFINAPELGIAERLIKRVKRGRFVLLPITDKTRGHGTHTVASVWKKYLEELLRESGRP